MSEPYPRNKPPAFLRILRRIILPWRSLTWQIFFLAVIPLTALVVAIAFGSLSIHQRAMRALVGERDARAVRTAAAALEEQINHRIFSVKSLAIFMNSISNDDLLPAFDSLEYLLPEFDQGIVVLDPGGRLVAGIGDLDIWHTSEERIQQLAHQLAAGDDSLATMSSEFTNPSTNETVVVMLATTPRRNLVAGGAFYAANMVQHTLTEAFTSGPDVSVVVMDASKRLMFASGSFAAGVEEPHPGFAEALNGEMGVSYVMVGSEEHVVAFSPVHSVGWALVLEEPWEMVASPTLRASQLAPLVLVPVLILAVVALWFGADQIVNPLQMLEKRAAKLAWGDFHAITEPAGGIEEIRHLQKELILMAHKVQAAQKSLRGYIGAITAAQEEERRRLARELHDDTIQALIALKQRVQLTRLAAPQGAPAADALEEIGLLTEQTIENLRRLTRALRPIYLEDLGLVTALEMQARETGQMLNIPVSFQSQGAEKRLSPSLELALYRMTQEAFSNIARHAQASQAALDIRFTDQAVIIEVSDDGVGFDVPHSPAEFAPSGHYGLLGLYERAELIGANLVLLSKPGEGTRLSIRFPLAKKEEPQQ